MLRKSLDSINSQLLKYLEKHIFQLAPAPKSFHKFTTQASFDKANAYKEVTHHLSFQSLTPNHYPL